NDPREIDARARFHVFERRPATPWRVGPARHNSRSQAKGDPRMPYVKVGEENSQPINLFFKDWGTGQPIVFSHGWPLSADAWESQMVFLADNGYRAIAHDRRGHGRSTQSSGGNDMNTYADD